MATRGLSTEVIYGAPTRTVRVRAERTGWRRSNGAAKRNNVFLCKWRVFFQ